ncbi:MAG: homoserine kinase [Dehalococcoidia bacterium]
MERTRVAVRVPATTANLGPGFDCLGMALDLWNVISVEASSDARVTVQGEGASRLPGDRRNLVYRAITALFRQVRQDAPSLAIHCENHIPVRRGLGSSAAAVVGGLVAANALYGQPLSQDELLALAAELEGHPDNAAAALLGGCRIVVREEGQQALVTAPIPLPEGLNAVLFIPHFSIPTRKAREVLPPSVSREDAVYNMGRVALLVNALATGKLQHLPTATQDRLHQPARQQLFPGMRVLFQAALGAGALGVFLSGAGSTILALTHGREMTVAYEMAEAAKRLSVEGTIKVTRPTVQGAQLLEREGSVAGDG